MKGLIVGIYQSKEIGNCSNHGISSEAKTVTIIGSGIPEIFEPSDLAPAVKIVKRNIAGEYLHAEPLEGKNPKSIGWMAGGSFIYSCDGRFPSDYPIPLHDRQESLELNDVLSR